MIIVNLLGLSGLMGLWGLQIARRAFLVQQIKRVWLGAVFIMLVSVLGIVLWQYLGWKLHPLSKHFLPPYQSIGYFLSYVWSRFVGYWATAFLTAGVVPLGAVYLNRIFGERFFEREEGWFFSLGILLTGYPGFFFYVALMLIGGSLLALTYGILGKGRAPMYFLWFPAGVFVILIEQFILPASLLNPFRF